MMQDRNVIALRFYFRMHQRNSIRNMQFRNLDVFTLSLEVCSESSVQMEDFMVTYQTVNLMNLF